jgi:membrane-associated protein
MISGLSQLAVTSPLSYLAAFWIPALDAVVPILPSETAVIALGVATAGSADPRIAVLLFLAAFGAFAGDNLAYLLGRRFGPAAERRFFAGQAGARRLAWAQGTLDQFGARLIIVCRFIPGGRTAVTVTCGIVGYRRKSFVAATAGAAVIWAGYAFFLGRLGGRMFEDRPWAGFLLALGAAVVLSILVEAVRRFRARRRRRPASPPGGPGPAVPTAAYPGHDGGANAEADGTPPAASQQPTRRGGDPASRCG